MFLFFLQKKNLSTKHTPGKLLGKGFNYVIRVLRKQVFVSEGHPSHSTKIVHVDDTNPTLFSVQKKRKKGL